MLMDMPLPLLRQGATTRGRSRVGAVDLEDGIRARVPVAALVHAQGTGAAADFLVVAGAGLPAVTQDPGVWGGGLVGVVVAAYGEKMLASLIHGGRRCGEEVREEAYSSTGWRTRDRRG